MQSPGGRGGQHPSSATGLPGFSLGISPAMPTEAQSHAAWLDPPSDPKELSAHRAQLKKNLEALECQIKSQQALKCGQVRINELTEEYSVILYMFVHAYPAKERVLNQDRYIERAKKRVADALASEEAARTALATAAASRAALQEDLDKAQALHVAFKTMQEIEEAETAAKAQREAELKATQEAGAAPPWRPQPATSPFMEVDGGRQQPLMPPPSPFVTAMGAPAPSSQLPLGPPQQPQASSPMPQVIAQLQAGQSALTSQLTALTQQLSALQTTLTAGAAPKSAPPPAQQPQAPVAPAAAAGMRPSAAESPVPPSPTSTAGEDGLPTMSPQELHALRVATGLRVGEPHLKSMPVLPGQKPLPWPVAGIGGTRRSATAAHPEEPAEKALTLPHQEVVDVEKEAESGMSPMQTASQEPAAAAAAGPQAAS